MIKNVKYLNVIFNDKTKKNNFKILYEAFHFWFYKKELPKFYFMKFLYRKDILNPLDYLSSKETDKITLSKKLNKTQYNMLLENKLAFAFLMEKNNINIPKTISYNFKNKFYYDCKHYEIKSNEDLYNQFNKLIERSPNASLFIKNIATYGGVGCFLFNKENLKSQIEKHGDYILQNDCIHQENIEQHDAINDIYKKSINTIRICTYRDNNNNVHLLSAFQRFGSGGGVIDNASKGGLMLPIDLSQGTLAKKSIQLMSYYGKQYTKHPDSGFVFENFKIPFYKEAIELTRIACTYIPNRIIGWDIAITPTGPCLIEGNHDVSLNTLDLACDGIVKHPLFNEIINQA